jgi:hypothetical protein
MILKFYSIHPDASGSGQIVPLDCIYEHDWKHGFYRAFNGPNDFMPVHEFFNYDDYLGWLTARERDTWLGVDKILKENEVSSKIIAMGEGGKREQTPYEKIKAGLDDAIKMAKDHINPSHYQGYIQELQWLEAMQYLPRFRNPESFIAAVELQGRKYWDRNGGKDEEEQELQKGIWYFKFLLAYIKNGRKPIRVADINTLIGDMGQGSVATVSSDSDTFDLIQRLVSTLDALGGFEIDLAKAQFTKDQMDTINLYR